MLEADVLNAYSHRGEIPGGCMHFFGSSAGCCSCAPVLLWAIGVIFAYVE